MLNFQELGHPEGFDYEAGSPHIRHGHLRQQVDASLSDMVTRLVSHRGQCRVLEIGAGHGAFTTSLLRNGVNVTVTEMSEASASYLRKRFEDYSNLEIIHDPSGTWLNESEATFDAVVCVAVLHHIPDYLGFLEQAFSRIHSGGAFISWQDPLWYPRRSRLNLAWEKTAYYSWRITQGQWLKGFQTRIRRARGILDESDPSDMVEYHVVRDGVDEQAIVTLGKRYFSSTAMKTYWSTQAPVFQTIGGKIPSHNTFGLHFQGKIQSPGEAAS